MTVPEPPQVTLLLREAGGGDGAASEELLPLVYAELRRLARAQLLHESPGQTLQPTALVHEAYVRLVGDSPIAWNGRGHFYGAAAQAMRRILVERARRRSRLRHGGDRTRVSLDDAQANHEEDQPDVLSLDAALTRLEAMDARKAEIVRLRYFAGLTIEQTALATGLSQTTVKDAWTFAKAWLRRAIREIEEGDAP